MTQVTRLVVFIAAAAALLGSGCATSSYTPIRTHFNKGVLMYEEENYEGAAHEYRLALEEDPLDHRARFNLAVTLEEMDRKDLARAEYEWILSVRPQDLRASANLAAIEIAEGNTEAGYARLQALVERYDTMAMPRVALATHYLRDGRIDEAQALACKALAIDPADVEALYLLGSILEQKGDALAARTAYEKALKNSPNDVASLLALGRVERKAGRPQLARSYLKRAARRSRNSVEAQRGLAELAEADGDLEEAALHFWEVRRLDAAAAGEVSERLARIYQELLREEQARPASQPASRP